MKLVVAGWRSVSLVDVYGHSSFTLWTCECNLRCPFCHNWRLAERDPLICREVGVDVIIKELEASKLLVDYVHVTGGEPLLQYQAVGEIYREAGYIGIKRSLNSNLTLPQQLKYLLGEGLVDHVATDLKIPPIELYGLDPRTVNLYWENFLESLKMIKEHGVKLELRIPLSKRLTPSILERYIGEIWGRIDINNTLVLLNPLLSEPYVKPRNPSWCRENCGVDEGEVKILVEVLKSRGIGKVFVKSIPGF